MGTLTEHSKTTYTEEKVSHDGIRTGSLQRIADARELIAKDRVKMEQDLRWYKESYNSARQEILSLESQIKGLRISKTRFRNQLDALKNKEARP